MICPHCNGTGEIDALGSKALEITPAVWAELWFVDFWSAYPRKVAKAAALKAWKRVATSEAIRDEIMAGLGRAIKLWESKDFKRNSHLELQFIPHASTWLTGRRWEDEASGMQETGAARVIACSHCADTGLCFNLSSDGTPRGLRRCSCARGALPGLVIPQDDMDAPAPF